MILISIIEFKEFLLSSIAGGTAIGYLQLNCGIAGSLAKSGQGDRATKCWYIFVAKTGGHAALH